MAVKRARIDFEGFLDLARDLDTLGEKYLKQAVTNALEKSAKYLNDQTRQAMQSSQFNFKSTGDTMKSLAEVEAMPIEWEGYIARAYVGVYIPDAPQGLILPLVGTPHHSADKKTYNAMKGKGKHKKEIEKIQSEEFNKVIQEGLNG